MKRKKIIRRIVISIILIVTGYFLWGTVYNFFAGLYYKQEYKKRVAEKTKKQPVTYYVSVSGNDANDGKSEKNAWQTINKLNEMEFNPGDSILFKAGEIFSGNLLLNGKDLGTIDKPVTITSLGNNKAIIKAGDKTGIQAINSQAVTVSNLVVVGSGALINKGSGIAFINNLPGNIKLPHMRIDNVEVSGFGFWGIVVDGNNRKSGFSDVIISNSVSHDNAEAGVYVYGEFSTTEGIYAHENILIKYVTAYNNSGKPGKDIQNTGSGIVLSDANGGKIEYCTAYNNGWLCESSQGGPVGIWAWDSKNIIIQYNESYGNKTNGIYDGGGFDLDGGMLNSVIQYNYSHDNDGAGYLLAQFSFARNHKQNIIRYNISENDCRKNKYGAIHVWGNVVEAAVYNNTIFQNKTYPSYAVAIRKNEDTRIEKVLPEQLYFSNNIFQTTGLLPIVSIAKNDTGYHFINNNYFTSAKALQIDWAGKIFNSLPQWRNETGQEKQQLTEMGFNTDPQFMNGGNNIKFNNPDSIKNLNAYMLKPSSPLINKGMKVPALFDIPAPQTDFNNKKIVAGNNPEPGACEFIPAN